MLVTSVTRAAVDALSKKKAIVTCQISSYGRTEHQTCQELLQLLLNYE